VFTDDEEAEMAAEILRTYIIPGKIFIGATFRAFAMAAYAASGRDPGPFKCSRHFIDNFKRRHRFSSRRFHIRRRRHDVGRTDIAEWIHEMTVLLLEYPHERIVNCDETMWTVLPNGLITWAPVGEDGISVQLNLTEKEAITALASVTAAHDKLPLFLIAKGKTDRVESTQLGGPQDCVTAHSPSGWTTLATFHSYLGWLRDFYQDGAPIHLILDCYSVHRSGETRRFAAELGIILHFIPPGWTDELQPLDRYIFGALKSICRRLFQRFCIGSAEERIRISDAVGFLREAWNQLETKVIARGWGIYEDVMGGPEEADDEDDGDWEEGMDE
jgi:transposase